MALRAQFVLISCFLLIADSGFSQSVRGTILGTVTDSSGAVIKGVHVTVQQTATGLTRTEVTNDTGEYSIPQLPVGPYIVAAEESGFKKTERTGVELRVDDRLGHDDDSLGTDGPDAASDVLIGAGRGEAVRPHLAWRDRSRVERFRARW